MTGFTPEELGRLYVPITSYPGLGVRGLDVFVEGSWRVARWWRGGEVMGDRMSEPAPADEVVIDLTIASAADRVARYIGVQVKVPVRCTAPTWGRAFAWKTWGYVLQERDLGEVMFHCVHLRNGWGPRRRVFVPGLVNVDPWDKRVLPDGSSYHERLALAVVGAHVGTFTPVPT